MLCAWRRQLFSRNAHRWRQARLSRLSNLVGPVLNCHLPYRDTRYGAIVFHTNQDSASIGVGECTQALYRLCAKGALKFKRLRFASGNLRLHFRQFSNRFILVSAKYPWLPFFRKIKKKKREGPCGPFPLFLLLVLCGGGKNCVYLLVKEDLVAGYLAKGKLAKGNLGGAIENIFRQSRG